MELPRLITVQRASQVWRCLNGVFCIYRPTGVTFQNLGHLIARNLANDFNSMERKPIPEMLTHNSPNEPDRKCSIFDVPHLRRQPLVVGLGYQPEEIRIESGWGSLKEMSGVTLAAIGSGTVVFDRIMQRNPVCTYHIRGRFGLRTDNYLESGRVIERTTFGHIRRGYMERFRQKFQKLIPQAYGVDPNSQEACELQVGGLVRPGDVSAPLLYRASLIDFHPPYFVIEIHCINETDKFLVKIIDDISEDLKSAAVATRIRRVRWGSFNLDHALLKKYWTAENIIKSFTLCGSAVQKELDLMNSPFVKKADEEDMEQGFLARRLKFREQGSVTSQIFGPLKRKTNSVCSAVPSCSSCVRGLSTDSASYHWANMSRKEFYMTLPPAPKSCGMITTEIRRRFDYYDYIKMQAGPGKQREHALHAPVNSVLQFLLFGVDISKHKGAHRRFGPMNVTWSCCPQWDHRIPSAKKEEPSRKKKLSVPKKRPSVQKKKTSVLKKKREFPTAIDFAVMIDHADADYHVVVADDKREELIKQESKEGRFLKLVMLIEVKDDNALWIESGRKGAVVQLRGRLEDIDERQIPTYEDGRYMPITLVSVIGQRFRIMLAHYIKDAPETSRWVITDLEEDCVGDGEVSLGMTRWSNDLLQNPSLLARVFARYLQRYGVHANDWFMTSEDA